jgi:protein O-GlcNAc transferase
MISHIFRMFLCCLFLFVPIGARAQTVAASDAELRQGQKMYLDGDLAGALSHYRQVALSRPNDPNVLFLIAQALGDQGSLAEAEATYLKTIPLYQQLQARASGSGVTYQPNIAMTLNNLAAIYSREKRFAEASKAIEQALTVWPSAKSTPATLFVTRGIVLEGQQKTAQAQEAYRAALSRAPQNPDALLNLGVLLANQGVTDEAIKLLRQGVSVSPNDPEMFAALGNSLLKAGMWDDGVVALRKSDALQPDAPSVLFNLSSGLQHQGQLAEALVIIQKAHALAPGDASISASLGELLVQTGHAKDATVLLQGTLESHHGDLEISLSLAKALESQGKAADAFF